MSVLWKSFPCDSCKGKGIEGRYIWESDGREMVMDYIPDDCSECEGRGWFVVSEHDRIALYPGGSFLGSWPGKYASLPEVAA